MHLPLYSKAGSHDLLPLRVVERGAIFYSVAGLFIALFLYGADFVMVGGFLAGALVGIFNFRFLKKLASRLMDPAHPARSRMGILFLVKIIFLFGIAGFLILGIKLNAVSFAVGFSAVIFGIIYESLKSLFGNG